MNNETSFRRLAAISAIIAALLILASTIVLSTAVNFNFDFLSAPGDLITADLDAGAAQLFRWGTILECIVS
jgi:cytochrome c-type biogenesis protein CcmE